MTPLPKRKLSTKRQGKRRQQIALTISGLVKCNQCHQPKRSHAACPHCHAK